MDYIETYQFSPFSMGGGGIPLVPPTTNALLSHLSIPGGLIFVDNFAFEPFEKTFQEDPTKVNVMENFDVLIDLVSLNNKQKDHSKTKKNKKTNKKISYKLKQKYRK
jgi:hypothetical protein